MPETESMSYVAKTSCGCIVAATVDDPGHANDTGKWVGDHVRRGFAIQRVTTDEVRNGRWVDAWPHKPCEAVAS